MSGLRPVVVGAGRPNALAMHMAAMSLVSGSSTPAERMMEHWKREDEEREKNLQQLIITAPNDSERYHDWDVEFRKEVKNAPMCGYKNISPYRVHARRQKNKAARAARRHQRRNKKCRSKNTKSA